MIDDIRLTFTALREASAPVAGDLAVLRLESVDDVFLGIDADGHPHLLLPHGDGSAPTVGVATLQVGVRTLLIGGQAVRLLDVGCLLESLVEVFDHFLVAVLERLAEGGRAPAKVVSDVLSRWQLFLMEGASPSRDSAAAVFGELLVLLDVVRADPQRRIDAWVGPFGARHDLRRGSVAVEVKTTRAHTSRLVTIHGEDQLEEPEDGTLYLHLVRLEEVAQHGRSVPSLVDELLSLGVLAENLFEALSRANVPVAQLANMLDVTFDVRERLTLPVDNAMPRIISSSFTEGARPVGIVDITYRVDLDHCLDRAIETTQYIEIINFLATGRSR
jgi:hypothetical protein